MVGFGGTEVSELGHRQNVCCWYMSPSDESPEVLKAPLKIVVM